MHWYMADPHFGHAACIETFGRPFADPAEMDAAMLANLQAKVGPEDDLWIIGDFAWEPDRDRLAEVFAALPGARRHLVRGNRDRAHTQALGWDSIRDIVELEDGAGKPRLVLCHYPMVTWNQARRGAVHLFGHVHNNWAGAGRGVNVGVELWDYGPVNRAMVEARIPTLPVNPLWAQAEPGIEL